MKGSANGDARGVFFSVSFLSLSCGWMDDGLLCGFARASVRLSFVSILDGPHIKPKAQKKQKE